MELKKFRELTETSSTEGCEADLAVLVAEYPFFQAARMLLVECGKRGGADIRPLLARHALYLPDLRFVYMRLNAKEEVEEIPRVINDITEKCDRTESLIDAFLDSAPSTSPTKPDVSTDYMGYLLAMESEEAVPQMKRQDLIDSFIEYGVAEEAGEVPSSQPQQTVSDEVAAVEDAGEDEACLTETLARIYIRQKKYGKALEIIRKLSLKYPKKNAYFADQIRFLEKLINNNKRS